MLDIKLTSSQVLIQILAWQILHYNVNSMNSFPCLLQLNNIRMNKILHNLKFIKTIRIYLFLLNTSLLNLFDGYFYLVLDSLNEIDSTKLSLSDQLSLSVLLENITLLKLDKGMTWDCCGYDSRVECLVSLIVIRW